MIETLTISTGALYETSQNCKKGRVVPGLIQATRKSDLSETINNVDLVTAGENMSITAGVIRILLIPPIAFSALIAWYIFPWYICILSPVCFYMIVTAFTLYCPIKALILYLRRQYVAQRRTEETIIYKSASIQKLT